MYLRLEKLVFIRFETEAVLSTGIYIHVMCAKWHQRCSDTYRTGGSEFIVLLKAVVIDKEMVGALKAEKNGSDDCTVSSH